MVDYIKIILLLTNCFVIIFALFKLRSKKIKRDNWRFLLSSLVITIFLALIIVIKPHHMLRAIFNIPNTIAYMLYFVIVGFYFLICRKIFLRFKYVLIIISFMFFGLANAVDLLSDAKLIDFNYNEILENIFHVLGIIFWLLFFVDYSNLLKRNTNNY